MKKNETRWTGLVRDALILALMVVTAVLTGVAGSALAHDGTTGTTRAAYTEHVAHHTVGLQR